MVIARLQSGYIGTYGRLQANVYYLNICVYVCVHFCTYFIVNLRACIRVRICICMYARPYIRKHFDSINTSEFSVAYYVTI